MRKIKLNHKEYWAKVILSEKERSKIFTDEHASTLGGHCGKSKCLDKIRESYYWPGICKDIADWVSSPHALY